MSLQDFINCVIRNHSENIKYYLQGNYELLRSDHVATDERKTRGNLKIKHLEISPSSSTLSLRPIRSSKNRLELNRLSCFPGSNPKSEFIKCSSVNLDISHIPPKLSKIMDMVNLFTKRQRISFPLASVGGFSRPRSCHQKTM